jgi:hypothetical protein
MDQDIAGMEWMRWGPNPHDPVQGVSTARPEWCGTGLCAEAQADGVPCTVVGGECDCCARARAAVGRPTPARS